MCVLIFHSEILCSPYCGKFCVQNSNKQGSLSAGLLRAFIALMYTMNC